MRGGLLRALGRSGCAGGLFLAICTVILVAGCAGRGLPDTRYRAGRFSLSTVGSVPDGETMGAIAVRELEELAGQLELTVPLDGLTVILFDSGYSMRRYLREHCPEQASKAASCFQTLQGYTITLVRHGRQEKTLASLRHELAHYLLSSHYRDFPPWIDEGLAQYFESGRRRVPPGGDGRRGTRKRAARMDAGNIAALAAVPSGGRLTKAQYRQAGVLVRVLMDAEEYGLAPVKCYLEKVRSGGEVDAMGSCFDASPEDLEAVVRKFLSGVDG